MSDAPRYYVYVCPECHEQAHLGGAGPSPDMPTYCLNHENEPGRKDLPAHVLIEVTPKRRGGRS